MIKKILVIAIFLGIGYGIYRLIDKQGATDLKNDTVEFVQDTFSSGDIIVLTGNIDEAKPMESNTISGSIQGPEISSGDTKSETTIITEESLGDVNELNPTPSKIQTPVTGTTTSLATPPKTITKTTIIKTTTTKKTTPQKSSDLLHTLFQ